MSKDNKTLYLYVDHNQESTLKITGLESAIRSVKVVGYNKKVNHSTEGDITSIALPHDMLDPTVTVVAVTLKEPIKLKENATKLFDAKVKPLMKSESWSKKHEVALNDLAEGIPAGHYNGPTALSKDKNTLYLFVDGQPNGPLTIKGLKNNINRIWVVGNGTKLSHQISGKLYWSAVPGIAYIDVPESVLDKQMTVIAVLLDGPVDLYREEGQVIESN